MHNATKGHPSQFLFLVWSGQQGMSSDIGMACIWLGAVSAGVPNAGAASGASRSPAPTRSMIQKLASRFRCMPLCYMPGGNPQMVHYHDCDRGAWENKCLLCAVRPSQKAERRSQSDFGLAERAGFEPAIRFPVYTLSRRAPSTTRPPLRGACHDGGRRILQGGRAPFGRFPQPDEKLAVSTRRTGPFGRDDSTVRLDPAVRKRPPGSAGAGPPLPSEADVF